MAPEPRFFEDRAMPVEFKHHIVVVEDDEGMRRAMGKALMIAGFETEAFESAEAMLAAGAASKARCLVSDIWLPGMSGLDLQRHLVAAGLAIPVVFVTAHDALATRRPALASGAAYLVKPFASEALVQAVTGTLKN
jgi:FixJ family two-component response regulator